MAQKAIESSEDMKRRFAILVVSCDKYKSLWRPFFSLFDRYYRDCPYPVYLLSNSNAFTWKNVKTIAVGEDASWSGNLLRALPYITEDFVLLLMEDLFLQAKVNREVLDEIVSWLVEVDANYVRLNPSPKPDRRLNKLLGIISPGELYRASVVHSIWKKEFLSALLREGESAWDFEIDGTKRSDCFDGFYSTYRPVLRTLNSVIKGKLRRRAAFMLKKETLRRSDIGFPAMTMSEEALFGLKVMRSFALSLFPHSVRRRVREMMTLRKVLVRGRTQSAWRFRKY